jgi:hypothetical protein
MQLVKSQTCSTDSAKKKKKKERKKHTALLCQKYVPNLLLYSKKFIAQVYIHFLLHFRKYISHVKYFLKVVNLI